jgi:hypothetical protein
MADPNYQIWIRGLSEESDWLNKRLIKKGLVTVYSKLQFKIIYNNVGGWTLTMPAETPAAKRLKESLIGPPGKPNNTEKGFGGIVVTRNGEIVFSGPVREFTETGDYTGPDGREIEFAGACDNVYLLSRIPMAPAPATAGEPPTGTGVGHIGGNAANPRYFVAPFFNGWGYYVYGGPDTETTKVIANLLDCNIGRNAPLNLAGGKYANRRIPWFNVANIGPLAAFGPKNYRQRYRYSGHLLEKVQEAANYLGISYKGAYAGAYRGIAFRTIQIGENGSDAVKNTIQFQMWDPRNPNFNRGVVFSAGRGNIGSYKYTHRAPEVNYAVVGGQSGNSKTNGGAAKDDPTGVQRWFEHLGYEGNDDENSRFGYWEGYIDRRDVQYEGKLITAPKNTLYNQMSRELTDAMKVYLREKGEQVNIDITAINAPPHTWPEDYNVGHIVKVVIDNYEYDQIVREVTVTLTKDEGEVVVPVVGTEATGQDIRLFKKFNTIDTSINTLNASQ